MSSTYINFDSLRAFLQHLYSVLTSERFRLSMKNAVSQGVMTLMKLMQFLANEICVTTNHVQQY